MSVIADTHAVIWFMLDPARLSAKAWEAMREALRGEGRVLISAVTLVEITYLVERARLSEDASTRLWEAIRSPEPQVEVVPVDEAVAEAVQRIPRDVVPDMPDRIIAATALHLNLPLVTCDGKIRSSSVPTIW